MPAYLIDPCESGNAGGIAQIIYSKFKSRSTCRGPSGQICDDLLITWTTPCHWTRTSISFANAAKKICISKRASRICYKPRHLTASCNCIPPEATIRCIASSSITKCPTCSSSKGATKSMCACCASVCEARAWTVCQAVRALRHQSSSWARWIT